MLTRNHSRSPFGSSEPFRRTFLFKSLQKSCSTVELCPLGFGSNMNIRVDSRLPRPKSTVSVISKDSHVRPLLACSSHLPSPVALTIPWFLEGYHIYGQGITQGREVASHLLPGAPLPDRARDSFRRLVLMILNALSLALL